MRSVRRRAASAAALRLSPHPASLCGLPCTVRLRQPSGAGEAGWAGGGAHGRGALAASRQRACACSGHSPELRQYLCQQGGRVGRGAGIVCSSGCKKAEEESWEQAVWTMQRKAEGSTPRCSAACWQRASWRWLSHSPHLHTPGPAACQTRPPAASPPPDCSLPARPAWPLPPPPFFWGLD